MPVRARMPDERFKQEYLKRNPDLMCVQRGCDVAINPILTASHPYGFFITHNGVSKQIYGDFGPGLEDQPAAAMEDIRKTLDTVLHRGEIPPVDPLVIERG